MHLAVKNTVFSDPKDLLSIRRPVTENRSHDQYIWIWWAGLNAERCSGHFRCGNQHCMETDAEEIRPADFTFNYTESGVGPSDHASFYLRTFPFSIFWDSTKTITNLLTTSYLVNYEGMKRVSEIIYQVLIRLSDNKQIDFQKRRTKQRAGGGF